MNFEEIKRKLEEINRRMDRYSAQQLVGEFNKVYEEAKGNAAFGESLKYTMDEIMDVNKGAVAKGNKGTLTNEQMEALEGKLETITNAVKEAKELRENSEIDKIDDYMGQKIAENEETKELYQEENRGLKAQKIKLDPIYNQYQENKKAEEITQKIAKIMGEMSTQFDTIANSQDPKEQAEAREEIQKHGAEASNLLKQDTVKGKLEKYNTFFDSDPATWQKNDIMSIEREAVAAGKDYKQKKDVCEQNFEAKITQVPDKYKYTSVETKLESINNEYKDVDQKWKALGGEIDKNRNKIKELDGQNKAYKEYAENVKDKEILEEQQLYSDEELEQFLNEDGKIDETINADAEVQNVEQQRYNASSMLATYESTLPKEVDKEDVVEWKRQEYLRNHQKKAEKQLKRINKIRNEWNMEEATMDDLINNTDKVTKIKYRGDFWNNHRYFEAKIPVVGRLFKNRYAKQYLNHQTEQYRNKVANLEQKSQGMRRGKSKEFVQSYRENISANHDIIQQNIDKAARQMYEQNMGKEDR